MDYGKLERHHIANEHKPVEKFLHSDYEVAISEGGLYTDIRKIHEYPNGWYEVSYTIFFSGHPLFESWIEFDGLHDLVLTKEGRRGARIAKAVQVAKAIIDDWDAQGFRIEAESIRRKRH